jgi:lipid II:glycine glycyltransferase (peptidoglycan interpeptide bridge formation enzyme)
MIREVKLSEKKKFNTLAAHPMQTWEWGEFREKTGISVSRLGRFQKDKLVETAQITWHKLPKVSLCVGYWPKGVVPSREMVESVKREAKTKNAIFVTMEPNVLVKEGGKKIKALKSGFDIRKARALFTKWSFWLDLTKSEEKLLSEMKSRTRYNVRYAERKGVQVIEDNSKEAFDEYWRLTQETTARQGFYAHTKKYHEQMFETLQPAGIAHLFKSVYEEKVLTTWIVFTVNGVLYYPYGASTRELGNIFHSDAMMWRIIRFGKEKKCKLFDMWGSPGPDPKPTDPWIGFHRFKMGYGAKLVEFVGSYDLVVNPLLYPLYRLGNDLRWVYLKLKAK